MGRPKKYQNGGTLVTLNLDNDVLDVIDNKAKGADKNRSEFITDILTLFAMDEKEYCGMMAKKAAQEMQYWRSKKDLAKK